MRRGVGRLIRAEGKAVLFRSPMNFKEKIPFVPTKRALFWVRNRWISSGGTNREEIGGGRGDNTKEKMEGEEPAKYLRKFYLRVHPDIIQSIEGSTETNVQINAESIGRFNALLDIMKAWEEYEMAILEDPKPPPKRPRYPGKTTLDFYLRPSNTNPEESKELNFISLEFNCPKRVEGPILLKYFYRFISRICREAGVEIPRTTQSLWMQSDEDRDEEKVGKKKTRIPLGDEVLAKQDVSNEIRQMMGWSTIERSRYKVVFRDPT
ncbi:hypothetical protein AAMO2058_000406500 [Amorphochlora amoebiformis]